jgi:hypothetical protein
LTSKWKVVQVARRERKTQPQAPPNFLSISEHALQCLILPRHPCTDLGAGVLLPALQGCATGHCINHTQLMPSPRHTLGQLIYHSATAF